MVNKKVIKKMIIKKHISHEGKIIVAICDSKLLGKKIEEGDLQLDLTSNFYKGDEVSEQEALDTIKLSHVINVVGEKSVDFVLKNGFIKKENVLKMNNVPYAQALVLRDE